MNLNNFFTHLSNVYPISREFQSYISRVVKEEYYLKNQVILSAGQISNRLWFMEKGFAMEYSYKNNEKKPYRFWDEGKIIIDVSSFFRQIPSEGYIEILEPSTLLAINYNEVQWSFQNFTEMHSLALSIMEDNHNHVERTAMDLLTMTPEERYRQLLMTSPSILQKVGMKDIASYLGISRKTLSRIRAKKHK